MLVHKVLRMLRKIWYNDIAKKHEKNLSSENEFCLLIKVNLISLDAMVKGKCGRNLSTSVKYGGRLMIVWGSLTESGSLVYRRNNG